MKMQAAGLSFRQIFVKTMFMGLKLGVSSKKMSYQERKRVIKLLANIAMAVAGNDNGMNWSRALINWHARHVQNNVFLRSLFLWKRYERINNPCFPSKSTDKKMIMIRRFGRTSSMLRRAHGSNGATARIIAKSLVKKRTRMLRRLVPGSKSLDDFSLMEETVDYVVALQAQVKIMRLLTEVLSVSNLSQNPKGGIP